MIAEQLGDAAGENDLLRIPVDELLTVIAPLEHVNQLIDHLKRDPDRMSRAEAKAFRETDAAKEMEAALERVLKEEEENAEFRESGEKVKQAILDELTALRPMESATNVGPETVTLNQSGEAPKTAQVVPIEPSLIPVSDLKDTKALADWLVQELKGVQFEIRDDGTLGQFTTRGLKDSAKRRGEEQRQMYAGLKGLLESAIFDRFEEVDEKHREKVTGQNVYHAAARIGDKLYSVRFKVDLPINKTPPTYKDHKTTEIEPAPDPFPESADAKVPGSAWGAVQEISVEILRGEVKPSRVEGGALYQAGQQGKTRTRSAEENEADAMILSRYFSVRAEQLGMLPGQLFERFKLAVRKAEVDDLDDARLNQNALTPTQAEVSAWRNSLDTFQRTLRNASKKGPLSNSQKNALSPARMKTPAALRYVGEKSRVLTLSVAISEKIEDKHPDVPPEVFQNLPALLHDPLYIYPYRKGGVSVVIDATTAKGEPLVVGIRDGRISTITPVNNTADASGWEILYRRTEAALRTHPGEFVKNTYARDLRAKNNEAPAQTIFQERGRASVPAPYGSSSLGVLFRNRRNVVQRFRLVKENGESYYQDESAAPLGAFLPKRLTIALLDGENLSTVLHEAGHFFYETDLSIAEDLYREQEFRELSEKERALLSDVDKTLAWFGIPGDTLAAKLSQWAALEPEEKRRFHERFARAFERYLFTGKAPSIELQPYFQKFKEWFKSVYTSIQNFLDQHPEAGKLNAEMRGVFDRMLATDEEIALAEQARNIKPLFETSEQGGMTPEEFAEYQDENKAYANASREELLGKALTDMKWLSGAQSRILKEYQREAKAYRAEAEAEARAEVEADPVYHAWLCYAGVTERFSPNARVTFRMVSKRGWAFGESAL
jgi:hypothetical protein